jgi:hypothetical protein
MAKKAISLQAIKDAIKKPGALRKSLGVLKKAKRYLQRN